MYNLPLSYVLDLIEAEGMVDEFNAYAQESGVPVIVSAYRFCVDVMGYPGF